MKSTSLRRARRVAHITVFGALSTAVAIGGFTNASAAKKIPKKKVVATTTTAAPITTPPATAAPTTAAPASPLFQIAKSQLGDIMVDRNGLSLYMFEPDAKKPGGSLCNGQCAEIWPPIIVKGNADLVAPPGFAGKLSTVKRDDGTLQAAVNNWPIYGWIFDKTKGDLNGQANNEAWWVLDPTGTPNRAAPTLRLRQNKVGVAAVSKSTLVDAKGLTVYMFEKDITKDVSSCYDGCAAAWPPLTVTSEAQLSLFQGSGIDKSKLKLIRRADTPAWQVSYNGWPLYTWARDAKPGDTTGQAVGNVWWVLEGNGTPFRT